MSLKRNLSIALTLGVSVLWLLGALASGIVVQKEMNESFDKALEQSAQLILSLLDNTELSRSELDSIAPNKNHHAVALFLSTIDSHHPLLYRVLDQQGNVLFQSIPTEENVFTPTLNLGFSSNETHRIYATLTTDSQYSIHLAEPLIDRNEDLLEAAVALLSPLLILAPVSLLGIWWVIRRSLRNVDRFQHSIEKRDAGDLSPVDMTRLPEEFEPIAVAVNRLLLRLRRALDTERSFTANRAHELRTPLATALAKVQRLQATMNQDKQAQQQLDDVETSLKSLAKQSEKLLELAKAEGGSALSQRPQDLAPILTMIVRDFAYQDAQNIRLTLPTCPTLSFLDADAFAILARNLIENALKHGKKNQPIDVNLHQNGTFQVINECDLISADELALLRNRFKRSNTQAAGSGLGLAIVDAICTGAGLNLVLISPATGKQGGFEVVLNTRLVL